MRYEYEFVADFAAIVAAAVVLSVQCIVYNIQCVAHFKNHTCHNKQELVVYITLANLVKQ